MTDIKKALNGALTWIDKPILQRLYLLMDYNNKGAITEEEFLAVMRPWASFSATDINNDNSLDISELKTLIWLQDGEEPGGGRIQKDLALIDDDKSGTIDRLEWIQFLISPPDESGAGAFFDFSLKSSFDKFDKDHDGSVDLDEFILIVLAHNENEYRHKSEKGKESAKDLLSAMAEEIFNELDEDKSECIDWKEFKSYRKVNADRQDEILNHIK